MSHGTKFNVLLVLAIFIIVTLVSVFAGSTGIKLDFGEDVLTVSGPKQFSGSVSYDSIADLELVNLEDLGEVVSGDENSSYCWGTWTNSAWERYTLCVSKAADTAICVTTAAGERLVFNYQNDETTAQIYEMFTQLLAARRAS